MPPRSPRPPLTHFLCLPLLTPTSTPQLKASLVHLKSVIQGIEPAADGASASPEAEKHQPQSRPLVPSAAFRPLGTLHLTLGVMSLKEPERLQGAVKLLEELDLEAMLKNIPERGSSPEGNLTSTAEALTTPSMHAKGESCTFSTIGINQGNASDQGIEFNEQDVPVRTLSAPISPPQVSKPLAPSLHTSPPMPLSVSLRSVSQFPPTTPRKATVLHTPPDDPTSRLHPFCLSVASSFIHAGYILPEDRDLTLHATLVNTTYAKKSRGSDKRRMGKLTFDATEILRLFNEQDGMGAAASSPNPPPSTSLDDFASISGKAQPFTFASHIPIDRVQICEMGAKKLDPGSDPEGLGEKYVVVAEKMILSVP